MTQATRIYKHSAAGTDWAALLLGTGLGLTLLDKRLLVVKSMQHFHTAFAPLAREVMYVATPGAVNPDVTALPYRARSLDFWPRVAAPAHRPI